MKNILNQHSHLVLFLVVGPLLAFGTFSACHPRGDTNVTAAEKAISPPPPSSGCPSPDKAIVSLTYDDNLPSQLQNAVPMLDARGIRATFFLTDVRSDGESWKTVRAAGHELASHTFYHPCTCSFDWVTPGNGSEDYSMERMATEMDEQMQMLLSFGETPPFSFAYPCGTTWIGEGQTSYIPLVKERFIAARGVSGDIVTNLDSPMNVPAYFLEGPIEAFIGSANAAIQSRGWVVFGFHGVGGDYLAVSSEDHAAFLDWLMDHRAEVAVLPFRNGAQCMMAR